MVKDENHAWSMLFKLIPESSHVLDIGCSSGHFGRQLMKQKKCIVDGIELDEADSKIASKYLRNVWTLNIETDDLNAIKEKYDVIILADVIEHLVFPSVALQRIKHLLKPSGILVFSVPNMSHISVRLALLAGKFTYTETGVLDKTHLHYYDFQELQRVLNEGGMEINTIDYPVIAYPKTLVEMKLKQLGLRSNPDFYQHIESPGMTAYQFIGTATYVSSKPNKKKLSAKQAVQNDYILMADEITGLKQEIERVNGSLGAAQAEIEALRQSRAYKLARRVGDLTHTLKRPANNKK